MDPRGTPSNPPTRKKKTPVKETDKDEKYRKKREKNNMSAKRSRDSKKEAGEALLKKKMHLEELLWVMYYRVEKLSRQCGHKGDILTPEERQGVVNKVREWQTNESKAQNGRSGSRLVRVVDNYPAATEPWRQLDMEQIFSEASSSPVNGQGGLGPRHESDGFSNHPNVFGPSSSYWPQHLPGHPFTTVPQFPGSNMSSHPRHPDFYTSSPYPINRPAETFQFGQQTLYNNASTSSSPNIGSPGSNYTNPSPHGVSGSPKYNSQSPPCMKQSPDFVDSNIMTTATDLSLHCGKPGGVPVTAGGMMGRKPEVQEGGLRADSNTVTVGRSLPSGVSDCIQQQQQQQRQFYAPDTGFPGAMTTMDTSMPQHPSIHQQLHQVHIQQQQHFPQQQPQHLQEQYHHHHHHQQQLQHQHQQERFRQQQQQQPFLMMDSRNPRDTYPRLEDMKKAGAKGPR